jgi:hypothetical protein
MREGSLCPLRWRSAARASISIAAGVMVALVLASPLAACSQDVPAATVVTVSENSIEFPAVVTAAGFEEESDMAGYHFIVWHDGRAASRSLFRAEVSDVQVLDAIEALGAVPGNALSIDTWDERNDPDSTAPDKLIEGPPVDVYVIFPGQSEPLALEDILLDPGQRGFDMRFGGHRDNIGQWHSGCVVCLYSCPGSKIGNASYTVREFVDGATRFRVRPGVLPEDGTEVTIRVELAAGRGEAN